MISILITLSALVAAGATQSSSVVSLFIPFANPSSLVASIAGSDSTATSYVVNCANSAVTPVSSFGAAVTGFFDVAGNFDACGFDSAFTVVQGPSTVDYTLTASGNTEAFNCKLMGTTQAICTDSMTGSYLLANSHTPIQTDTIPASLLTFFPVTITAGADKGKDKGTKTASPAATATVTASTTGTVARGASNTSNVVAQSTNAGIPGSPVQSVGIMGALGAAVAGAML
ncbi:hypothetical protein ACLMJK_008653 [Lecanora helva]